MMVVIWSLIGNQIIEEDDEDHWFFMDGEWYFIVNENQITDELDEKKSTRTVNWKLF